MGHIIGSHSVLGWVAVKAALLYLTAVLGFRLGERRTLAEMSAFDFVAAVAVGSIVGRVPNASDATYAAGAVTLIVILALHRLITRARFNPLFARLIDQSPRLIVADSEVVETEMRRVGLTRNDLYGLLRQNNVKDLSEVRYVIYEQRGQISVVRCEETEDVRDYALLRDILRKTADAVGSPT